MRGVFVFGGASTYVPGFWSWKGLVSTVWTLMMAVTSACVCVEKEGRTEVMGCEESSSGIVNRYGNCRSAVHGPKFLGGAFWSPQSRGWGGSFRVVAQSFNRPSQNTFATLRPLQTRMSCA